MNYQLLCQNYFIFYSVTVQIKKCISNATIFLLIVSFK